MKNKKGIMALIFGLLALIFLGQSQGIISWLPVDKMLYFFGLPLYPEKLFLSVFKSVVVILPILLVLDVLLRLGFKQVSSHKKSFGVSSWIWFFTIWISFFSFAMLSTTFPNFESRTSVHFMDWFLFFYFAIQSLRHCITENMLFRKM